MKTTERWWPSAWLIRRRISDLEWVVRIDRAIDVIMTTGAALMVLCVALVVLVLIAHLKDCRFG